MMESCTVSYTHLQMTGSLSNTNFNGITPEIKEILDECPDSAKTCLLYTSIELSKTEQKLLRVLCENRGKVLKREYLIDEVWQGDTEFAVSYTHLVLANIRQMKNFCF